MNTYVIRKGEHRASGLRLPMFEFGRTAVL